MGMLGRLVNEIDARTIFVGPDFEEVRHPVMYPALDRIGQCVTKKPDLICSCGMAFVEWSPPRRDTCISWWLGEQ
jgi:hypothetical protein